MASLPSVKKAQIPLGCQLCDSRLKICWKCINCSLLLCSQCKEIHLNVKKSNNHKIIDIKEVGPQNESGGNFTFKMNCQVHTDKTCVLYCKTCEQFICIKCVTTFHKGHDAVDEEEYKAELHKLLDIQKETESKLKKLALNKATPGSLELEATESREPSIKVSRQYTTDLNVIANMLYCSSTSPGILKLEAPESRDRHIIVSRQYTTDLDVVATMIVHSSKSLWITDRTKRVMKRVKLKKSNVHILSEFNIFVVDMTLDSNKDILLSVGQTRLKLFNENTGQMCDTNYNIEPLVTFGVHFTRDNKVIMGAGAEECIFTGGGRRLVIVMDEGGNRIKQFEHDSNKMPLFTAPVRITSTSNGNICVLDVIDDTGNSRVIVLGQEGNVIQIYTGHPDINSRKRPFNCLGVLTTPADNIIVTDLHNQTLHILNSEGVIITYFRTDDLGIMWPYSLALSKPGSFYLGCATEKSPNSVSVEAKLYRLKYSGF